MRASWITLNRKLCENHVQLAIGGSDGPHTVCSIGVVLRVGWGFYLYGAVKNRLRLVFKLDDSLA